MPEIASESVNIVISTRTLADINSILCRLARAITEFYRVLKLDGQIVLSDECPCITSSSEEEEVAVKRWQLVKAVSHLTGRPHANEIKPEDLEFIMHLAGFQKCRWAIFKGDKISQPRIDHFVTKATEQTRKIRNARLKKALRQEIMSVREMFDKQGGIFPPRYILHAQK
jgi:hypothetical protein